MLKSYDLFIVFIIGGKRKSKWATQTPGPFKTQAQGTFDTTATTFRLNDHSFIVTI